MILNADADRLDLPSFEIGIGVNTGIVIAGTLGGRDGSITPCSATR